MKLNNLEICFMSAMKMKAKYVGIKIWMQGFDGCEIIINPTANFESKLEYYKRAYNDDLTLKSFNSKIVGFTYGDSFEEIEKDLKGEQDE